MFLAVLVAGESDRKELGYLVFRKGYFPALQMVASCDRGKARKFLPQHLKDSMLMSSCNYLLKASPPNPSLGKLKLQSASF